MKKVSHETILINNSFIEDFQDTAEVIAYDHVKQTRGICSLFNYKTLTIPRAIPWLQLGFLVKNKFIDPSAEQIAAYELKKLGLDY